MRIKVLVAGLNSETWFKGQRDERNVSILNCLDADKHVEQALKETFDYAPNEEELKAIDFEKLRLREIVLGVSGYKVTNARLKLRGAIDRSSVPKEALIPDAGGKGAPQAKP